MIDIFWKDGDICIKSSDLVDVLGNTIEMNVDDLWGHCIYKQGINLTEFNRAMLSDISYPIWIAVDDGIEMIIDGHHRLYKAQFFCKNTIPVKILDLRNLPDKFKIFKKLK